MSAVTESYMPILFDFSNIISCKQHSCLWRANSYLLSLAFFIATLSGYSQAASIERTFDQYVIVSVLGEKLKFREKDVRNTRVTTRYYPCLPDKKMSLSTISLDQWLNDPKTRDCMNNSLPNEAPHAARNTKEYYANWMDFEIYPVMEEGVLYPGGVEISPDEAKMLGPLGREPLRWTETILLYSGNIGSTCAPREATGTQDKLRYTKYKIGGYSPVFMLPSRDRLGLTDRNLCLVCGNLIQSACRVEETMNGVANGLFLSWDQGGGMDTPAEPIPEWRRFDQIAREIAKNVIISRPAGAFQ